MTKAVMYSRNRPVPMKRAKASASRPTASGSRLKRGTQLRRAAFGVSRRSTTGGSARTQVHDPGAGVVVVALAPVLGQQVVQDVVHADRAEQPSLVVEDGHRQQV